MRAPAPRKPAVDPELVAEEVENALQLAGYTHPGFGCTFSWRDRGGNLLRRGPARRSGWRCAALSASLSWSAMPSRGATLMEAFAVHRFGA